MTLLFSESFWGDKNNGFEVIYHNFKDGVLASKEFGEFVSAVFAIHDLASNNFKKLMSTKNTSGAASSSVGSFTPLSLLLKTYAEHMSGHYGETAKKLQELLIRIQKYGEQQKEKQKQVRQTEQSTEQHVKNFRELNTNLLKCREEYHSRSLEFEKSRRSEPPPQQKELDRLEARVKKSRDEYRVIIDRFNNTREDFERRMKESCVRLQELEEAHLDQMKTFIASYFEIIETARKLITKTEDDSRANIAELSREKLLEIFVKTRTTGSEKPGAVEFEEPDFSQLPPLSTPSLVGALSQPELIPLETRQATVPAPTAPTSSLNNFWNIVKPRTKTKSKRVSKDVSASVDIENPTDNLPQDPDSLSNETPEPNTDPLANSGGFQSLDSNGFFGGQHFNNNGECNDDEDSFDSDSDDGVVALRQLRIKEKDEAHNNGMYGTVEDISQIMRNVTLNPNASVEPKKRTMKKSLSMGGSNSRCFLSGSQSSFELNRSPLSTSMTPEDINRAFDPLYVSPTPPPASAPAPMPVTPALASHDIQSLFSSFPDQALVPPPVAERRTQTPKPPSPPISPLNFPNSVERTSSPPLKTPTAPPPAARSGPPPPPPARARYSMVDSQNTISEKSTLRRQPESASAVLASIPEVHISSTPSTTNSTVANTSTPLNGNGTNSNDAEVAEIQENVPKKALGSQSTSALPMVRPRSHTPQANLSGTTFISPPYSHSSDEGGGISQSPMATSTMAIISTEASFASLPRRTSQPGESLGVTSRGPSPFDGQLSQQIDAAAIPIAVSFSESIDAVCRGLESSQCCGLKVAGRLTVSFPAGFAKLMTEIARGEDNGSTSSNSGTSKSLPHPLMFRVSPVRGLNQVHHYRQLVAQMPSPLADSLAYRFEMSALAEHLAKHYEAHKSNSHFNIDILKYELRPENCMHASPLAVSYRWQQALATSNGEASSGRQATLNLVVRHRGASLCPVPLAKPKLSVVVEHTDTVTATPQVTDYDAATGKISWELPDLTASSADYLITADVRFKDTVNALPPHALPPLSVSFGGEGHLFSALKFDLVSIAHYRMSLFRKMFKSGRYDVEPDGPSQLAYV